MHALLITAAGSSSRMGFDKLETTVAGIPILEHTLRCFLKADFAPIVLTVPAQKVDHWQRQLAAYPITFVAGGSSRQHSILLGLHQLALSSPEFVWIHDGARPQVSPHLIQTIKQHLTQHPNTGVIPTLPITDTVKLTDASGVVLRTLDRTKVQRAQTPQAFPFATLYRLSSQALEDDIQVTDDASIYEHYGEPVQTIPGSPHNLKITVPEDLSYFQPKKACHP